MAVILAWQTNVFEGDEGEGEGLHGVGLLLVVKDHPVRGQVEAAGLLAGEGRGRLPREVHRHVVAEEEDAGRVKVKIHSMV